ncbi:MAG: serine--tRNA ligase [Candidatus Thermoplasmatota archaeon]|nr:serine--tRNA ligase [Candidatus Thermoplasmatota archaeon]
MLDIKYIRENPDAVQKNADQRKIKVEIKKLLELDQELRNYIQKNDLLRTERNEIAEEQKKTKGGDAKLKQRARDIKEELCGYEAKMKATREMFDHIMLEVPNVTHPDTPLGEDDADNKELRVYGKPTKFDFKPKDHIELGKQHDLIDFEKGAKVAGSGFYYVKNEAALMELGLIQYAFDYCRQQGFTPIITPDVAYKDILSGTGFNPRGEETNIYNIENTDLSLIATAEISLAGYYKDHTFKQGELDEPKKFVALSHCFRTEAGAYGRESHGLYRVHQFSKVEMFIYCKPEDSDRMHEHILEIEEKIMQQLEIPYRVVDTCTGDLGGPAYRKYDIEAWMPYKNNWGEVTSTSNCTDYQARRLNVKYKNEHGKNDFVHTLNGTAIVTSRIPICIFENFQDAQGGITIPKALQPYTLGVKKIG